MKIRNGFVSNSSSSSFIIGYGEIIDRKKLIEYCENNKIPLKLDPEWMLFGEENLCAVRLDKNSDKDFFCMEAGNETTLEVPEDMRDKDVLLISLTNDEGDSCFYNYESKEFDYNINLGWFNEVQQKMYNIFYDASLIKNGHATYGAERNG